MKKRKQMSRFQYVSAYKNMIGKTICDPKSDAKNFSSNGINNGLTINSLLCNIKAKRIDEHESPH